MVAGKKISKIFAGPDNNIWSVNDYALRDLLVFLVQKYRIDEVYDSKVKAQNWEKLIEVIFGPSSNCCFKTCAHGCPQGVAMVALCSLPGSETLCFWNLFQVLGTF